MAGTGVQGVDRFLALSKALKEYDPVMRREFNKRLREAVKPLTPATRQAAMRLLPRRGGLNRRVALTPQRVSIRTGKEPGISLGIVGQPGSGARAANRGKIRRPTFGRAPYRDQVVPAGWFDDTVERLGPEMVRPAVEATIAATLDELAERVRSSS